MSTSFRALGARAGQRSLRTPLVAVAACLGTGLLLAACSGPESASSSGGGTGSVPLAHGVVNGAASRPQAAAPRAAGAGSSGQYSAQAAGSQAKVTLSTQSIIHTAFLTDRVSDVTAAATTDTNLVTAAGGYVSGEQETVPPGRFGVPQISLELKIPAAQWVPVLARLRAFKGGREISFTQHAQDVTQQVANVGSRVASAQAAISQLRALLQASRLGRRAALGPGRDQQPGGLARGPARRAAVAGP